MSEGDDLLAPRREGDEDRLLKDLQIDLSHLDQLGKRDLLQRLRASDAEGAARLLNQDRKKGAELIKKTHEIEGGVSERAVLRTPDARRLGRELLSLFSELAASDLGRQSLQTATPTLDADVIRRRLDLVRRGVVLRKGLVDRSVFEAAISSLREAGFAKPRHGDSGVIAYFESRSSFLKAASALARLTQGIKGAEGFVGPLQAPQLAVLSATLEGLEEGGVEDAEAAVGDAELEINEALRRGRVDADSARRIVEENVEGVVSSLGMNAKEEEGLRRSALEGLRIPFEFEKASLREVLRSWRGRREEEAAKRRARAEASLKAGIDLLDGAVSKVLEMDVALAIAAATERYLLVQPSLGTQGEGFVNGRNPFLVRDTGSNPMEVRPVSYSLGKTETISVAKGRNVAVLTGANSGGKTTLLATLASVHILTLYGLPVPCEKAEVVPLPVYLFRKRVTRRIGSLEHALSSLIPVFGDRRRKLVLIDEFEALTEPGAAGRIMAGMLNEAASGSSLVLVVTHLARETLPHVRLPIRVDGIEAKGLDQNGDLVVDRQPVFGHIGSSMPKLIIMKLSRSTRNRRVKALYDEILASIREEKVQVQAPIATPWTEEDDA
ncbi:MAG TPA: hypothetical protein VMS77_05580 [Conexivisphaerales archaeon]|nr:hypothetical protein [Conexivisphaerales archaeon]